MNTCWVYQASGWEYSKAKHTRSVSAGSMGTLSLYCRETDVHNPMQRTLSSDGTRRKIE